MKYFSILVFFIFICLPVTALANPLPSPSQCPPECFVQCFDCATGKLSNDTTCSYCRICRQLELQTQCPASPTRPIADPTPARPIELPNNDKDDDDSSACSASPYAPSHTPLAMLLLSLLMLGLAIPARKQ